MSAPVTSVCIPTCDGAAHLGECLDSVLAQTDGDYELLIVDDGSRDATLDVVAARRDPRIVVHRNPRRLGIPRNWNRCLELARGAYVKFVFQDDVLAPTALARLRAALDGAPDASLAFGRREIRHEDASPDLPLHDPRYRRALDDFYASFHERVTGLEIVGDALVDARDLTLNVIGEPSFVLLRAAAVRDCGGFDPAFTQLVDWELWLRLASRAPLAFVDATLGVFRVHAGGASARNHRSLRMPLEFVRVLRRVAQIYGARLPAASRRRLREARWRARLHVCGEAWRRFA